jgi:RNA methyltransferase, TrmH family
MDLTSPQNPRIKRILRLGKRSERDAEGVMVIEGYREVRRALDHGVVPLELYYAPDWFRGGNEPAIVDQCRAAGARLATVTREVFTKISYRDRPEGLLLVAPRLDHRLDRLEVADPCLIVVAEAIEKPGNLGSILRSADATGTDAVLVCEGMTDIHNPNVIRSSLGTIFTLPVVEAGLDAIRAWLHARNIQIVATSPDATLNYTEVDLTRSVAIVVGAEQYGLQKAWLDGSETSVRLPMLGKIDSLNVACATTVLLYEVVRQRQASGLRPQPA